LSDVSITKSPGREESGKEPEARSQKPEARSQKPDYTIWAAFTLGPHRSPRRVGVLAHQPPPRAQRRASTPTLQDFPPIVGTRLRPLFYWLLASGSSPPPHSSFCTLPSALPLIPSPPPIPQ
jgi:hypothetical protein